MEHSSLLELSKLLLPEVLVEYFEMTNYKLEGEELHFYFKEHNTVPIEFKELKLISKGFHSEAVIQDFPIRGKEVYLHITRRRWLDKDTGQAVSRDWQLVSKGTRITQEFATFLKEISR